MENRKFDPNRLRNMMRESREESVKSRLESMKKNGLDLEVAYEESDKNLPFDKRKELINDVMKERYSSCVMKSVGENVDGAFVIASDLVDVDDKNPCLIKTSCTDDFRRMMSEVAKDFSRETSVVENKTEFIFGDADDRFPFSGCIEVFSFPDA